MQILHSGTPDIVIHDSKDSLLDYLIAQGNYHVDEFDSENGWMAKKYLFGKIMANPLLLNDPILYTFFVNELPTITSDFENVKSKILEEAASLSTNSNQLLGDHQNLDSLQKELEVADSLNVLFNGSNQPILATLNLIKSQIAVIVTNSKQLVSDVKQDMNQKSDSIKQGNSLLNVSETVKENEKAVNEIYLSTLAKGAHEFSDDQIRILLSIAHQCPYAGGQYVLLARAIYQMIDPTEVYYDDDLCTQLGYYRKSHPKENFENPVQAYPNPADESIKFEYYGNTSIIKLEIYDVSLGLIKSYEMFGKSNIITINSSTLAPGLYIYKLYSANELLGLGKISILH